jgi:hypothetical protein
MKKAMMLLGTLALPGLLAANQLLGPIKAEAGVNSRGVLIEDLNKDGVGEMIVANFGCSSAIGQVVCDAPGSLQIFAMEGGSLKLKQTLTPGKAPREVQAIDLNHDGRKDLLATLYGEDQLVVCLQQTDGSFVVSGKVATGSQPVGLAVRVADRPMVAVASYGTGKVQIFSANNQGVLEALSQPIAVSDKPCNPTSVAFITLDNKTYLATANYNGQSLSLIAPGTGSAMVIPMPANSMPCKLAVADFNGDGREDLAVALFGENAQGKSQLAILMNDGKALASPVLVDLNGKHPNGIAVGDVLGQGRPAVVLAGRDSDLVDVVSVKADGGFELKASLNVADEGAREEYQGPVGVACGDLNGDGKTDLACGYNRRAGNVKAFLQAMPAAPKLTSPSHADPEAWYPNPNALVRLEAAADINGIAGFRTVFDQFAGTSVDISVPVKADSEVSRHDLRAGEYYLHAAAVDRDGHQGAVSHLRIRVTEEMSRENVYNYPNPSRDGRTTIRFPLAAQAAVSIRIFDEVGGLVWSKDLQSSEVIAGLNQLVWEGVNDRGAQVGNGGYILKVNSGDKQIIKKIAIIR